MSKNRLGQVRELETRVYTPASEDRGQQQRRSAESRERGDNGR